ncbi:MAG: UDP-N-acetylglucosamine 2-epimerase [Phycisphaerales bacterium]
MTGAPASHETPRAPEPDGRRVVAVVTGTRAEFGLLQPVMQAIEAHPSLRLSVVVTGTHFLPPAETWREVEAAWPSRIGAEVPMQQSGHLGRFHDSIALGHGTLGLAHAFESIRPDWVVVLGDRIEALAAASAAAVAGVALAHMHGGDRAEGVADDAIRHAVSKLAHVHLAASRASAERLVRMGEAPERVHVVGSPAIDGLAHVPALDDASWRELGAPTALLLLHPVGDSAPVERRRAERVAEALGGERVLWLHPNHDPGRDGVMAALTDAAHRHGWASAAHLPRERFVGALKRLAASGGVMVGNSSAGLIEAVALGVPVVDIGERQSGRERPAPPAVVHVDDPVSDAVRSAIASARGPRASATVDPREHPYGDGNAGERTAALLARIDPAERGLIRKRNAY